MLSIARKKIESRLKKFIFVLLALYFMIGSALYYFQEKLLFFPTTLEQDYQYNFSANFEELFLKTEENATINALHFTVENPRGVILYFHGNAGDLSRWAVLAEYFVELHYDVFIMDYRTYGKSLGKLSEKAFYTDAQFCYDLLLKQYSENEITVFGRSLGTGIAAYVASKNKPKQLILETPYYSILDVAKYRFPILPVKWLLKYHFPTYKYLPKTKCPITILHGTADLMVPYSSAEKLLKLNIENLDFITINKGTHNNLIDFELYHNTMKQLLP